MDSKSKLTSSNLLHIQSTPLSSEQSQTLEFDFALCHTYGWCDCCYRY
jgi:hypothetical protein